MWGRFRQRKTRRSKAVEQATTALQNVRGRFGERRTGRKERAYGSAVWLGAGGALVMATLILLLLWLLGSGRRRRSGASSRGGGTTWSSKCGRCSPKGGTTTGRGTPREARGNAHHPTNRVRRRRTHDEAEQRHPPSYRHRRGDRVLRQQGYGPRHRLVL